MAQTAHKIRRLEMVDPQVAAILRRKTPAERIAMILESNQTMRLLIEGPLRERHPDWSDDQVRRAIARRMLGDPGRPAEVRG